MKLKTQNIKAILFINSILYLFITLKIVNCTAITSARTFETRVSESNIKESEKTYLISVKSAFWLSIMIFGSLIAMSMGYCLRKPD
ncbi:hypothetical protein TUBRATIS_26050 [Tubulinosema ratisbonensis]|uniref:Uncharacterized protein n=1 Tax=Tubulinosema ratisbonensis TaxID=291195 RepID=A0A437AIH7_9MICR|nr:hypothetical protein TUBRATIS_26050 [Tubulinosema ratisbonensis]